MTTKQIEEHIAELEKVAQEINQSPESARAFLLKTGIYNEDGSLSNNYK